MRIIFSNKLNRYSFFVNTKLLELAAVFLFAVVMVLIPWDAIFLAINGHGFIDKEVYLEIFTGDGAISGVSGCINIIDCISSEFLWNFVINWLVHSAKININNIFLAISFFVLIVFGLFLVKWQSISLLLFLINPLVIDFAFSQYRLALAISFLGLAYIIWSKTHLLAAVLVFLSLFLHTAVLLFVFLYISVQISGWIFKGNPQRHAEVFVFLFMSGVFLSIVIGPLRGVILEAVGDRRAEYGDLSSSMLYSAFWAALLIPFWVFRRSLLGFDYFRYAIVIISIVFINLFHGGYSTRFLSVAYPMIISGIFGLNGVVKWCVAGLFLFYFCFQWLYWLRVL